MTTSKADKAPKVIDAEDDAAAASRYQDLEFKGDTLQARKPTQQALAAFTLATSKYVTTTMRNDMTGLFISRHLAPESYEQVFSRLMDPDDPDYTIETIGELMRGVVDLS